MPQVLPTDLSAVSVPLIANAGDDIPTLPFTATATDTTGWTLASPIFVANSTNTGPTGSQVGSGTVTNTPGSPNSAISIAIAGTLTANYPGQTLWVILKKTNVNQVRTFAEITLRLK